MPARKRNSAAAGARRRGRRSAPALALVRVGAVPERGISDTERRLEDVLRTLARLHTEHEALSMTLSEFSERCEERLGTAQDDLYRAQSLIRRLEHLEGALLSEIQHIEQGTLPENAPAKRPVVRHASREGNTASRAMDARLFDAPWDLKELYKRLARRLHPDFAKSDEDRTWRSRVMARLNAAYADEDRVRLELLAMEIDFGSNRAEVSVETRQMHAEKRLDALVPAVERLERDLRWLRTTSAYRRFEDFHRHEERGTDYFAEALRSSKEQLQTVLTGIDRSALHVENAVRALNALRAKKAVTRQATFRTAILSPPPPTNEARRFRDTLWKLAREAPWKAAWIIAAFFGEVADRPPEGLASIELWAGRYEALRPLFRRAPKFEDALVDLPSCLELGCRVHPQGVRFGFQLRNPEHVAGVAAALSHEPCATIAANVLRALGPEVTCIHCHRRSHPVHLRRVRDLDPLQARCCPRCGCILESYRAYGRPEGLELLSPYALALGVVEEQIVRFGGVSVRLEMLPRERNRLTAERLSKLFREVLLTGVAHGVETRPLRVSYRRATLRPSARIPREGTVTLSFADRARPAAKRVVALLRARHRRRFGRRK